MDLKLYLGALFGSILISCVLADNPLVQIQHGILQGLWKISEKGRAFASFQGVPYAEPPVGENRFKEPQQRRPWDGVWDASLPLSNCLQYDPFIKQITGQEDCLFLNVYSPTLNSSANLPVVVFIHGGAFMYGTGNFYDPAYYMDWDVVVVTLNYRLGPMGFLSTGDEVVPGNMGLKDQAFVLHWIKDNIIHFGGNAESVTLTGNSAGGASVHYHYLSPLSEGTFARGVAYSGSAFSSWTHDVKPVEKAVTLATLVGCPTSSSSNMVACLRQRPGGVIVNAQKNMFDWKVTMFTPFTPTVEPANTTGAFLTTYPWEASNSGALQNLPLIAGVTSEEGLYPAAFYQRSSELLPELETNWEQLASNIFEYNDTLPLQLRASVAAKIKQQYLGGRPVSQDTFQQIVQALGDRHFVADVGRLAQVHALTTGQPMYLYRFSFRGEQSLSHIMALNNNNYGVSHADDLIHVFRMHDMLMNGEDDVKIREALIEMVYSFSTIGIPKLPTGNEWTTVVPGSSELNYLEIASPTSYEMKSSSDFGHITFWDKLGLLENENYDADKIKKL